MKIAVVGCGVFGLAAALELRGRGHDVHAYEQGDIPNPGASSFDTSKTIRRVYGADEVYVELVERALPIWREWQRRSGRRFLHETGYIYVVRNFGPGKRVYDAWHLLGGRRDEMHLVELADARRQFPQFSFTAEDTVLHDSWGGYLASAEAVRAMAELARGDGIVLHEQTRVGSVSDRVVDGQRYDCVVVAAGVWTPRLLPTIPMKVTRQSMVFFRHPPGDMPVYSIESDVKGWYGHPLADEGLVKLANDLRGEVVEPDSDRDAEDGFVEKARAFVRERIPVLADASIASSRSCLYENTPDHDFAIDRAPGLDRVFVATGGSGHGFKFGASIGPLIADAVEEKPNRLGDRFRIGARFS